MDLNEQSMKLYLQQISDTLLINGGFQKNLGLYSGEMGLVLFFVRFARYTKNDLYLDYSFSLIENVQNKIHNETPINYKYGLSGIGCTIEYLVQRDFFDADTDEILEDFDKRLFFASHLKYLSIENVIDIGYYALWRLSGNSSQKDMICQDILPQIVKVMEEWHFSYGLSHLFVDFYARLLKTGLRVSSIENSLHQLLQSFSMDRVSSEEILSWLNSLSLLQSCSEFEVYQSNIESIVKDIVMPEDVSGLVLAPDLNQFIWLQICKKECIEDIVLKKRIENNIQTYCQNMTDSDIRFQTDLISLGNFLLSEIDRDDSWMSLLRSDFYPNNNEPLYIQ